MIREERPGDATPIWRVNAEAFGQCEEADLVDALRESDTVLLSLVAEVDGDIVGHILFTRLTIQTPDRVARGVALAPLAVLPKYQRQGIGSSLVSEGLDRLRQQNERIVVVLGHPDFYSKFGFTSRLATTLASPFSGDAWMAAELVPGALDGIVGKVSYPPPFGITE
jgi:putative acetyltransferase